MSDLLCLNKHLLYVSPWSSSTHFNWKKTNNRLFSPLFFVFHRPSLRRTSAFQRWIIDQEMPFNPFILLINTNKSFLFSSLCLSGPNEFQRDLSLSALMRKTNWSNGVSLSHIMQTIFNFSWYHWASIQHPDVGSVGFAPNWKNCRSS